MIIKLNLNKIKVILVYEISNNINQNNLISFINDNGIPIYIIEKNYYLKIFNFFLRGEGYEYIYIYKNNQYNRIDFFNSFTIFQLKLNKNLEKQEENIRNIRIENMIKNMPKYKLENIINNCFYKTELCKYFRRRGGCREGNECTFAHGRNELENIESIRAYLIETDLRASEKIKNEQNNRNNLFKELKDETKNLFTILNIKLIERLLFDILYLESIKLSDIESIFGDVENIYNIYEGLCLEYYFNLEYNISNEFLREKIPNFFKKFLNQNLKNISDNKWILNFFKSIEKIDFRQNLFNLNDLNLINENNKNILSKKYSLCLDIIYDKLLFLLDFITKSNNSEYFMDFYFLVIIKLFIKEKVYDNSTDNFEVLALSKIINIIYNYYYDKFKNTIDNKNITDKFITSNTFDKIFEDLSKINLDEYFKSNNERTLYMLQNNNSKVMSKKTALLLEFFIKYFDLCLILFYRKNQTKFFDYMINKKNNIFKYYKQYKVLTLRKNNKISDYKEIFAFVYYLIEKTISRIDKKSNETLNNKIIFQMIVNHFNEFKLKNDSGLYDIEFKIEQNIKNDEPYKKLAVFCLDEKTKKYYIQDIIELNKFSAYYNTYKLRVNNTIYLVPFENINTSLYSINNIQKMANEEDLNMSIKYEDTPKYSWNIGYDGSNYLLLSEEDNNVYSFTEKDLSSCKPETIMKFDKIEKNIDFKDNKIVKFFEGVEDCSSFVSLKSEDIYLLDKNRSRYKWLDDKAKENIYFPIIIPKVKILNISANYNLCYIIGEDGNLYENNGKETIVIPLPNNTKRFLQCACGNRYIICIVENKNGKGILYSKGDNNEYQCGINNNDFSIQKLSKINVEENLDFKQICTYRGNSVALTSCGKLYIWGNSIKINDDMVSSKLPYLINTSKRKNKIIVDKIFYNHDYLNAIGRELDNGNYIKNLYTLDYIEKDSVLTLEKCNLGNKRNKDSRIIPINIVIGKDRSYCLCIDENIIIDEINKKGDIYDENNSKIQLSISYNPQSKKEENNEPSMDEMQKIYNSENLDKFINLFNSLTEKNIKDLRKAFDGMNKGEIKTNDIDYNELIVYLKNKNDLNDLLSFFVNNEKNEGIILFNYLKIRLSLIEEKIISFININNSLKAEGFIQNIIERNIIYLNDDLRVQYFYTILINMNNYYQHYMKKIPIDRFKASNFKDKFNENKIPDIHLNETIFGQLFHILGNLEGKEFLLEKGKKLFKVDLKGERAIDEGGPYNEILSDICDDLQSNLIELFIKTPNNKDNIGELRDKYIINPNANNIIYKKAFQFIGKLMILAISSGETFNLNLHPIIWKGLLDNEITFKQYETIDKNIYNIIENLQKGLSEKDKDLIESFDLNFIVKNCNEKDIELIENGQNIKVTLENAELYIELAQSKLIEELSSQIKYIREGLFSGIGKNILQILNWEQLEKIVCGESVFDMEDFKKHTKCDNKEKVIQWFWEWLGNCKEEDKFKYLKFVSGRSRLPKSDYEHIIQLTNEFNKFPVSHTCFSTLDLPRYNSKEVFYEKMNYVIKNVTNITDN